MPRTSITADEYRKALGHFAPRIQEKTVPGHDEDEVTLAVEAGVRALEAGQVEPGAIGMLAVIAERPVAVATVAAALGISEARSKALSGADSGAAVLAGLDHVDASGGQALVITVGTPPTNPHDPAEHAAGTAAVAVVCGKGGLRRERATHATAETVSLDRGDDLLSEAFDRLKVTQASHVFAAERGPGAQGALEKRFGKSIRSGLSWFTGDLGPASALANLAAGASRITAGESVLLITVGPQAATVLLFTAESPPATPGDFLSSLKRERRYLPFAVHQRRATVTSGGEPSQGAYVSPTAYLAELPARYRLVGEDCAACGTLHFPPRESCTKCGSRESRPRPLKRTGEVYSYTIIGRGAAPSEFAEQQAIWGEYATAIVQLDDGPRITAMLTDVPPATVKAGMRVSMVLRRLYTQEGVTRYGFKFRPWLLV